jgi:hypothetical protein
MTIRLELSPDLLTFVSCSFLPLAGFSLGLNNMGLPFPSKLLID